MQRIVSLALSSCLCTTLIAQTHAEVGDAGALPGTAQTTVGFGSLSEISGSLDTPDDADMFLIWIDDYTSFSATTSVGGTTVDTQLWLFDTDGMGIAFNDDDPDGGLTSELSNALVTQNGLALIAVSRWDNDPEDDLDQQLWTDAPHNVERAPDGVGAANPIDDWSGTTGDGGNYVIALTGASFARRPTLPEPIDFTAGRRPGSVLIFPVHRSGMPWVTILNVTNTATEPETPTSFGGSTNAHFEYVNVQPNPAADVNSLAKFMPLGCTIFDRIEFMTPTDHISVLTSCHNAYRGTGREGYVVVSAENPALPMGHAWKHNYLMGSEVVMSALGVTYMVNAISIRGRGRVLVPPEVEVGVALEAPDHIDLTTGSFPFTLEFDGEKFDMLPDYLLGDFIGSAGSQLALINFTGGPWIENTVYFEVYNDNELPLSATLRFRCWFDQPLECVSPLFSESNLASFPNDPEELDLTCDGVGDIETGWFRIQSTGTYYSGGALHSEDGAIHGSLTAGHASVRGGHLLWEEGIQSNGAFRTP